MNFPKKKKKYWWDFNSRNSCILHRTLYLRSIKYCNFNSFVLWRNSSLMLLVTFPGINRASLYSLFQVSQCCCCTRRKNMYPGAGFAALTSSKCFLFAGIQKTREIRITSSLWTLSFQSIRVPYILEAISKQFYFSHILDVLDSVIFRITRER